MSPDIVDSKTRSRMMSGIRAKNTKLEVRLRKALFARGFRYRLHATSLPGKPDMALPRYRAVVFVHGCFWHGHDCPLFRLPGTRTDWWRAKIEKNRQRDQQVADALRERGWRQAHIWECAVRGPNSRSAAEVADEIAVWLSTSGRTISIRAEE